QQGSALLTGETGHCQLPRCDRHTHLVCADDELQATSPCACGIDEPWNCSGLRLMENSFDNAHFSFVHAASFGDQAQPEPASIQTTTLDNGLNVKTQVPVVNPPLQQKNLQIAQVTTLRTNDMTWFMPFSRVLKITYPNGLLHLIFTAATPINDRTSQVVQFCVRNDTEADAKAEDIIAFDRQVTQEDKAVLESTDYDTPLDLSAEQHMASDQPGIIIRRKLAALLAAHRGERWGQSN
ncbi:hypothetical protein ACFE35_13205, partial [Phormidesmis priestleyi ANT.L61.2]